MNTSQTNIENRMLLQKLYEVTVNINDYLNTTNIENDHNLGLNITRLINQRGNIINQLNDTNIKWDKDDKELLYKINELNNVSQSKMQDVYHQVGKKISKIQQGKQVNQTYQQSYNAYNTDGSYFDSKK